MRLRFCAQGGPTWSGAVSASLAKQERGVIGFLNPLSVGRQVEAPTRSRGVATVEAGQPKARDCRRRRRDIALRSTLRLSLGDGRELRAAHGSRTAEDERLMLSPFGLRVLIASPRWTVSIPVERPAQTSPFSTRDRPVSLGAGGCPRRLACASLRRISGIDNTTFCMTLNRYLQCHLGKAIATGAPRSAVAVYAQRGRETAE